MKTNFTLDLPRLKFINGNQTGEFDEATKAVAEIDAFSKSLSNKIKDFLELREVMTLSDEISLKDAVTALRHLHSVLDSLCKHHQGKLSSYFPPVRLQIF